ncbi:hypothetical protein BLNAU_9714 [Blattamonas nauphoetae]|uniref:Uncharacterized protein n=1 Tax=Blattamonas nauphoetae TaxID=2049346 RepID=A0ABQ9XV19_9EUKA|nr:hypothetical protein BLNAU_9714 [Blattamonas nauphoetae]
MATLGDGSEMLSSMASVTELCYSKDTFNRLMEGSGQMSVYSGVFFNLGSPIPANRNAALVLLSKVCELATFGMVVDLCRFGVVECVIMGVEATLILPDTTFSHHMTGLEGIYRLSLEKDAIFDHLPNTRTWC